MAKKEFAVIYRWSVDSEREDYFRERWKRGTEQLMTIGSLGSCLTRDNDGNFIAFARWPSEEAREQAFAKLAPFEPWAWRRELRGNETVGRGRPAYGIGRQPNWPEAIFGGCQRWSEATRSQLLTFLWP